MSRNASSRHRKRGTFMRVLVAWDDSDQADLLSLYLGNEANEIKICLTAQEFAAENGPSRWDVVLMSLTFPKTAEDGFSHFKMQQDMMPTVPIVIACRQPEMLSLAKFMQNGLRFYIVRDDNGDFIFLVMSTLESAVSAARAEEAKKLTAL